MSVLLSLCLLAALAPADPPLRVTSVVRAGLPPYEDAARLYRLEGAACRDLKPGAILRLQRPVEPRSLGELEVLSVAPDHALARLYRPGATFPLRGDQAIPRGPLAPLPALPGPESLAALASPAPPARLAATAPPPLAVAPLRREPIYFFLNQATLTPAGQAKLAAWVAAWGSTGTWVLAWAPWPGESPGLSQARLATLREALARLGVQTVETRALPPGPAGPFPAIQVQVEP